MLRLPAHEATTAQLGSAYPFAGSPPLRTGRVLVGRDLAGGAFLHDPFALYGAGVLTNPNMVVVGQIGRGKSALMKTYLHRQAAFGRQIAVLDPKGEYEPLARALGTVPIRLSPRGGVRINPLESLGRPGLDGGPDADGPVLDRQRRLTLLSALSEAALGRRLVPREHLALEVALDSVTRRGRVPTLPATVEALLSPERGSQADAWRAAAAGTARRPGTPSAAGTPSAGTASAAGTAGGPLAGSGSFQAPGWLGDLEADGRDVALQLRRLVHGDLAGMFDGATSVADAGAALIVDLSEVYHSEALPVLMVCASAWLQAMTERPGTMTLLVLDEAWAVLGDVAVGRYLRSSWKLARAKGVANVAVCHRVSDLSGTGSLGSEASRLAEGLLSDSESLVCYAQPASEVPALAAWLGCSEEELALLPTLRRGVALWRVGGRSYLVEHLLGAGDSALVDTDERLRP